MGSVAAMALLFLAGATVAYWAESAREPAACKCRPSADAQQSGGNMEGKGVPLRDCELRAFCHRDHGRELRTVNSMHDSFTPLGRNGSAAEHHAGRSHFWAALGRDLRDAGFVILAVFIRRLENGRKNARISRKKIEAYT